MSAETSRVVPVLKNIATRLRIESIRATTESASGHPTTCMSAADLVAAPDSAAPLVGLDALTALLATLAMQVGFLRLAPAT